MHSLTPQLMPHATYVRTQYNVHEIQANSQSLARLWQQHALATRHSTPAAGWQQQRVNDKNTGKEDPRKKSKKKLYNANTIKTSEAAEKIATTFVRQLATAETS